MEEFKATRKIGRSHLSLTGVHHTDDGVEVRFESSLERDLFLLLDFDINVESFVEQPVKINYEYNGKSYYYTPDVLVYFHDDARQKPILYEVKYRVDIGKSWTENKRKYVAAMRYADSKGWKFKIITEKEIRTQFLLNVKFLHSYKKPELINVGDIKVLIQLIENYKISTPTELILGAAGNLTRQAEYLYTLWHLVATLQIGCDLNSPINMNSEIWAI